MFAKVTIHAAKIPEELQKLPPEMRAAAGNMEYVNLCDDRPWSRVPLETPMTEVRRCPACAYIMTKQPGRRDPSASIRP